MIKVKGTWTPSRAKIIKWIDKLGAALRDADTAHEQYIVDQVRDMHMVLFKSQGQKFGRGRWRGLEEKYARWKEMKIKESMVRMTGFAKEMIASVGARTAILILTGRLADSIINKEAKNHIEEIRNGVLTYGSRDPLAYKHGVTGITRTWSTGERIVRFPLIDTRNPAVQGRLTDAINEWLTEGVILKLEKEM